MDLQNFHTDPVTKIKRPLLHQLPTDIKYNHFTGENGENSRGAGNQAIVVPSTLPHLTKSEHGTRIFSQAAPMTCSHSGGDYIGYKLTSNVSDPVFSFTDSWKSRIPCPLSRPDLSSTRYSDEEVLQERSTEPPRIGVRSIFSGTRDNQSSSENLVGSVIPSELSNQRSWVANHNCNHNCNHSDNNVVDSSRYNALGVRQLGQFEKAEAEGNRKILSAESLDDERERLREVLQSQREFLKKQEQELRLLFDAQHLG